MWQGRFRRYEPRDGVTIPLDGEVEWVLPAGPQPYWRGTIDEVTFQWPCAANQQEPAG